MGDSDDLPGDWEGGESINFSSRSAREFEFCGHRR